MKISLRLKTLLASCKPGQPLWDLCCDHGYLGLQALASRLYREIIFNDAVPHVMESLRSRVGEQPGCRFVDGPAESIGEPLTGNVVLAGIGGEKIIKILNSHSQRGGLRAERLVLCPEKDAEWMGQQAIPGYSRSEEISIPHGMGRRFISVYEPR